MKVGKIIAMTVLVSVFATSRYSFAGEQQERQAITGQATGTIITGGFYPERKPAYGLVLFLEVIEKNYDNFEEKLPDVFLDYKQIPNDYYEYVLSDRSDVGRIEERHPSAIILDGILRPSRYKIINSDELVYDAIAKFDVKYKGFVHDSYNKIITVRHPLALVSWKSSMDGYGRNWEGFSDLYPANTLPFSISAKYQYLSRLKLESTPLQHACNDVRYQPDISIYSIKPDGTVNVIDLGTRRIEPIVVGGQWEITKEVDGNFLEPRDKEDEYGYSLYEKYAKGKDIKFKTITVVKNRGFMFMKWPDVKR